MYPELVLYELALVLESFSCARNPDSLSIRELIRRKALFKANNLEQAVLLMTWRSMDVAWGNKSHGVPGLGYDSSSLETGDRFAPHRRPCGKGPRV